MGTLESELAPHAERLSPVPRLYADANIPAGAVAFMRSRLGWDVLFVMEHDELRRAPDLEHFHLATRLRRTLVTLDRDYFDDRRFPPKEGTGVIVLSAPDERILIRVLVRIDRVLFAARRRRRKAPTNPLPLQGRKLHAHPDWPPPRRR